MSTFWRSSPFTGFDGLSDSITFLWKVTCVTIARTMAAIVEFYDRGTC
jgi:hypothetical protein